MILGAHGLTQGRMDEASPASVGRLGEWARRKRAPRASSTFEAFADGRLGVPTGGTSRAGGGLRRFCRTRAEPAAPRPEPAYLAGAGGIGYSRAALTAPGASPR